MKILFVAPYIYEKDYPEFCKNKTGFGFMVNDIFKSICGIGEDAYLVTNVITKGHNESILSHTWKDVMLNIKLKDLFQAISWAIRFKQPLKERLRYGYYCINKGSFRRIIRETNPDIVHIHGIGYGMLPYIQVCEELKVKYVTTLHGLIGLDESVDAPSWDKDFEKEFLIESEKKGRPVTVISSGIKKRIEKYYLGTTSDNIHVILNGTIDPKKVDVITTGTDIRKQLNISENEKLCIVSGSICERKNQIQIVDAFALLPDSVKNRTNLLICGEDYTNGLIASAIKKYGLSQKVLCLGFVCREELLTILQQADLNIVASKDEGFGLSIIEAAMQGVPTVAFDDLDAIDDLYDPTYMVTVKGRTTENLSAAIQTSLNKPWDKNLIKTVAHNFSIDRICDEYKKEYAERIKSGGGIKQTYSFDYIIANRMLGRKICAYIANISANKNQYQAIRAIEMINDTPLLILCGTECDNGQCRQEIVNNKLYDKVLLFGFCDEMYDIWANIDLNIFTSICDGFGLSIIEGYLRGVPSLAFSDLDAVPDIFDDKSLVLCEERTNEALATALTVSLERQWDSEWIEKNSKKFSLEQVRDQYLSLYRAIIC